MTREEAIKILKEIEYPVNGDNKECRDTAFNMAIEALKERPHGQWMPLPEKFAKEEIPKDYANKLTPVGFSQHDCESHYECPFCGEGYGSWSIPIGKPFKCKCGKYVWTD